MSKFGEILSQDMLIADNFDPKQKNMFILSIGDPAIPSFLIKTVKKPSITTDKITYDYLNKKKHYQGKWEWQDQDITLVDPIAPSGSAIVMDWLKQQHDPKTGRNGYASQYKKTITIEQLGPMGDVVEKWQMFGCFLTSIDWGDFDSSSTEFSEINLTLSVDECDLEF